MPKASFQVFTDTNTKVLTGYNVDSNKANKGVVTDKIENIMGSSAGAGSGEFHMYLGARNRENQRLAEIENAKKEEEERKALTDKVAKNKEEAMQKTQKNADKRKRLKEKKLQRRLRYRSEHQESKNEEDQEENNGSEDEDDNAENNKKH